MAIQSPSLIGLLLIVIIALTSAPVQTLAQDSYPSRPIRIIMPSAAGGGFDILARLIAPQLSERLKTPVVVENRTGAGTMIGNEVVAKAPPNGYTLLMGMVTLAIDPALNKKIPYDALSDFEPITMATIVPNLMVANPSSPAKSVKELIALAKARPGEIMYASSGQGTTSHLAMELFAGMAQIRMTHVPYKGATPGITDLLGGQVATMIASMLTTSSYVRAGRLRVLGVTTAKRVAAMPEIPTIAEAGLPGYESAQWCGLLAPAGTPKEIITTLHKELVGILNAPVIRKHLVTDGAEVVANLPEEFAAVIKADTVKWAKVVKDAGIRIE